MTREDLRVGDIIYHHGRCTHYQIKSRCQVKTSEKDWVDGYVYKCLKTGQVYVRQSNLFNNFSIDHHYLKNTKRKVSKRKLVLSNLFEYLIFRPSYLWKVKGHKVSIKSGSYDRKGVWKRGNSGDDYISREVNFRLYVDALDFWESCTGKSVIEEVVLSTVLKSGNNVKVKSIQW